jgi:hypothetical protein
MGTTLERNDHELTSQAEDGRGSGSETVCGRVNIGRLELGWRDDVSERRRLRFLLDEVTGSSESIGSDGSD